MKYKFILFLFLLIPQTLNAAIYYVDKDSIGGACSDSYTKAQNSISQPWCTIQRGTRGVSEISRHTVNASLAISAGDTLYIRAGTYAVVGTGYRFDPALNLANTGTSGSPILIQNYNNESVTITHSSSITSTDSSTSGPLIGAYLKNYVTWKGFKIVELPYGYFSDTGPVAIFGSDHVTIDCDGREIIGANLTSVHSTDNHEGIAIYDGEGIRSTNITVKNCRIHGFKEWSGHSAGIKSFNSDYVTIENNEIYDNAMGVQPKMTQTHWVVRYNFFHNNIGIGHINHNCNPGARDDFKYYQNVIVDAGGIERVLFQGFDLTNFLFYNNTIYTSAPTVFGYIPNESGNVHISVFNNLIVSSGSKITSEWYKSPIRDYWNFNHYYNFSASAAKFGASGGQTLAQWTATGNDTNGICCTTNPGFLNGSGSWNLVTDFKRTSYPNNGRGGSYPSVMGAYITGNELIGPISSTDILGISTPKNLKY